MDTSRMTASDAMLVAASSFQGEFSEWDLSVAAWNLDKKRFGMPGHPHPDHKRVYMELISTRNNSVVRLNFVTRTRENYYRLTPFGRAMAEELKDPKSRQYYMLVEPLTLHHAFNSWKEDPEQPKEFPADYFGGASFADVRSTVQTVITWAASKRIEVILGDNKPIHLRTVSEVLDFLTMLEYRFHAGI